VTQTEGSKDLGMGKGGTNRQILPICPCPPTGTFCHLHLPPTPPIEISGFPPKESLLPQKDGCASTRLRVGVTPQKKACFPQPNFPANSLHKFPIKVPRPKHPSR